MAASPITTEAVAEGHSLDVRVAVRVRPASGVRRAAVETGHTLQETFTPMGEISHVGFFNNSYEIFSLKVAICNYFVSLMV